MAFAGDVRRSEVRMDEEMARLLGRLLAGRHQREEAGQSLRVLVLVGLFGDSQGCRQVSRGPAARGRHLHDLVTVRGRLRVVLDLVDQQQRLGRHVLLPRLDEARSGLRAVLLHGHGELHALEALLAQQAHHVRLRGGALLAQLAATLAFGDDEDAALLLQGAHAGHARAAGERAHGVGRQEGLGQELGEVVQLLVQPARELRWRFGWRGRRLAGVGRQLASEAALAGADGSQEPRLPILRRALVGEVRGVLQPRAERLVVDGLVQHAVQVDSERAKAPRDCK
eukprot:scaffold306_cov241-Pinguiococcus_pyrenoidosus.AAC.10